MKEDVLEILLSAILDGCKVSTDSRTIQPGDIFIALKGDQFDGNTKAADALAKGAFLAVVDSRPLALGDNYIFVDDGLQTLQALALKYRKHLNVPTLAITGSNGKTTTKELLSKVLECRFNVHSTKGNLNNHIGVPLTILAADANIDMLLIEMGANQFGDIEELCSIADPDHGIISNIGEAHLEKLIDLNGVFKEKISLYRHVKSNHGVFFLNCSDPLLAQLKTDYDNFVIYTSDTCGEAKIETSNQDLDEFQVYKVNYRNESYTLRSRLIGVHNKMNISAAICVGLFFKIGIEEIICALESYFPENMRSQWLRTERNSLVLDAYNANPTSMKSAIKSFVLKKYNHPILILGDMLELGPNSRQFHQELIDFVNQVFNGNVILVGKEFSKIKTANPQFVDTNALVESGMLKSLSNATILIKASRGIKLEQLREYL